MQSNIQKFKINFPCPLCKINHTFELTSDHISRIQNFPFSYIYNHGDNALLLYIDKDNKVRGVEKIDITQTKITENEISLLNKVDGMKIKGRLMKDQKMGNIFLQK